MYSQNYDGGKSQGEQSFGYVDLLCDELCAQQKPPGKDSEGQHGPLANGQRIGIQGRGITSNLRNYL